MSHRLLDEELQKRAESGPDQDQDAKDFWHSYQSVKKYLEENYYRWIQAQNPWFTEHGEPHISAVIQSASALLADYLREDAKKGLSTLDIYLLLAAVLWHDVGNVINRTGHAEKITQLTERIKELAFPTPAIYRLVVSIAQAHSGPQGLNVTRSETNVHTPHKQYTVYPKALAAIVRFADEISENQTRVSAALRKEVPPGNRIYWEYAYSITSSAPNNARERIVIEVEVDSADAAERFECTEHPERTDGEGKLPLIEYILCRLEKMNNERAYCSPEFRRYVFIRQIDVRLTLLNGTTPKEGYEISITLGDFGLEGDSYPKIKMVDRFFEQHPDWKPEKIKEDSRK